MRIGESDINLKISECLAQKFKSARKVAKTQRFAKSDMSFFFIVDDLN